MVFKEGQRWISEMEPELGLGVIQRVDHRRVTIEFPAAACTRQYATESARLHRVSFGEGDRIQTKDGQQFVVVSVQETDGLIAYDVGEQSIPEALLCPSMSFHGPLEKLLAGLVDTSRTFDLRYQTLCHQHALKKLSVQGFLGGRVDLIPHQMYIAHEIASRVNPRVLLSDEVGLGKTIEACLVLHRLLITDRINRVLIAVPESLKHQWFVELLRKFNLLFRLMDADFCDSIIETEPDANPFLKDSLCLCSHEFLIKYPRYGKQACDAGWDMAVVDEAHHLTAGSPIYDLFSALSQKTGGLMLLTATPEQMGKESHFSRLQLLDPHRYFDYNQFLEQANNYFAIAKIADKIIDQDVLTERDQAILRQVVPDVELSADQSDALLRALIDRHGPGRVIFRNKRHVMPGFPKRQAHLAPLDATEDGDSYVLELADDLENNNSVEPDYEKDVRILWLVRFLKFHKSDKMLLICKSTQKAKAIEKALRYHVNIAMTLFYEELTLIQRDKNAAWFAQPDGAQLLISSEIGSEGRNFQFAHHLILFDLPFDPELLEQRIGRLDRIGQKQDVQIHVPYVVGSPQEKLVRWYHEGMNAFETNVSGCYDIYVRMRETLLSVLRGTGDVETLIRETRNLLVTIQQELEQGRDRLLEMASFRKDKAEEIVQSIASLDIDTQVEQYATRLFDHFGIQIEELHSRTYQYRFDCLSHAAFPIPVLREEGLLATFDRNQAVHLEDVEFLTWDHPMLTGAMELMLGLNQGNAALVQWKKASSSGLLLDALFVLECVAPPGLQADRFLPPTPVRIVMNHAFEDVTEEIPFQSIRRHCYDLTQSAMLENPQMKILLSQLIAESQAAVEPQKEALIRSALQESEHTLSEEYNRLQALKKVNPDVREEEIILIREQKEALQQVIEKARLRLDSVRLIILSEA